eukprot:gene8858-3742_t
MDQIHRLTNLSEINRILHETIAKERAIDVDLDKLLSKRVELERSFLLLNSPTTEMLELVHADSEQLLSSIQSTATLAEHISGKVRRLDCVQGRVQGTLDKINLILDRTNCINGVQEAMDSEDYESAANHIATFMDLEERLAGSLHAVDVGQAESQRQILTEARSKLEEVVARRFDEAVNRRDTAAAVRFAKLYKPLGKQDEGLRRFTEFLKLVVSGQARASYASLSEASDNNKTPDFVGTLTLLFKASDGKKTPDYVGTLTLLFKDIGMALEEHEPFIREIFGVNVMVDVVVGLQACARPSCMLVCPPEVQVAGSARRNSPECEHRTHSTHEIRRGGLLLHNRLSVMSTGGPTQGNWVVLRVTTSDKRGSQLMADTSSLSDPRQVEGLLEDVLRICTLSEEYNSFMLAKMRNAVADSGGLSLARESAFRSGQFNVGVRELLGHYMALEEYYIDETSGMAVRIDEVIPGSLTSSMVDDVFFILRKCGLRALTSGSVQATGRSMQSTTTDIDISNNHPFYAQATGRSDREEYAVYLNNCDVSAEYVNKLRAEFDTYMGGGVDLFASPSDKDRAKSDKDRAKSVISDLTKTSTDFRQTANKALEQLGEILMPRMKQIMDGEVAGASYVLSEADYAHNEVDEGWSHRLLGAFESALAWTMPVLTTNNKASYVLSEADYAHNEVDEGWSHRLLGAFESALSWTMPVLTTNNYESLLQIVLDKVLSRLEALMSRKQFNQLGGLQLDRDTRKLVSHLSELTSRTVRDKFAKLNQMAIILGLETLDEMLDYWGDAASHITWRLGVAEVRSILAQRVDFNKDAIMLLPLA